MSTVLPRDAAPAAATEERKESKQQDKKEPSAAQRLAESRERMREWMLRGDGRHEARRRAAQAEAQGESPALLDRLRAMPAVGIVIDALSAWWANHPLQPAAALAEGVARDTVAPLVRRHPLAVMAAAFVIGAAAMRYRPWRWLGKPALFGGLTAQIVSRAISHMPIESWLGALGAFAHARNGRASDDVDDDDRSVAAAADDILHQPQHVPAP